MRTCQKHALQFLNKLLLYPCTLCFLCKIYISLMCTWPTNYSTYIETWAGVVEQIDLLYWIQLSSIVTARKQWCAFGLGTMHMCLHPTVQNPSRPKDRCVCIGKRKRLWWTQGPAGCAICLASASCSSRASDYNNSVHTGAGSFCSFRSSLISCIHHLVDHLLEPNNWHC